MVGGERLGRTGERQALGDGHGIEPSGRERFLGHENRGAAVFLERARHRRRDAEMLVEIGEVVVAEFYFNAGIGRDADRRVARDAGQDLEPVLDLERPAEVPLLGPAVFGRVGGFDRHLDHGIGVNGHHGFDPPLDRHDLLEDIIHGRNDLQVFLEHRRVHRRFALQDIRRIRSHAERIGYGRLQREIIRRVGRIDEQVRELPGRTGLPAGRTADVLEKRRADHGDEQERGQGGGVTRPGDGLDEIPERERRLGHILPPPFFQQFALELLAECLRRRLDIGHKTGKTLPCLFQRFRRFFITVLAGRRARRRGLVFRIQLVSHIF